MSTDDASDYGALFAEPASEGAARQEGGRAVDAAILRMARAAGAQIQERPAWPGAVACTVHDTEPAAGIRFALMLQDAAWHKVRDYIKRARQDGMTWQQIGEALRLAPVAEERGIGLGEAAFDYAADAEHARPFETLSFGWTCPSCGGFVLDRGPNGGHPEDGEPGHADGCERLAAVVAAYEAEWADED